MLNIFDDFDLDIQNVAASNYSNASVRPPADTVWFYCTHLASICVCWLTQFDCELTDWCNTQHNCQHTNQTCQQDCLMGSGN